jgi:ADP-heptose:LPS heptosyltransferase
MRWLFYYWDFRRPKQPTPWQTVNKQRFRLYSYYFIKNLLPRNLRPRPWIQRYIEIAGGRGDERPDLQHLLIRKDAELETPEGFPDKHSYLCVMPSSKWPGKNWSVDSYVDLLRKLKIFGVILGTEKDFQSVLLCQRLKNADIPHFSGVGRWNLAQTARVLKDSLGYLGGDTGLSHLAEALGVPARVIFGPTAPDMGFGPWSPKSRAIGQSLWCRPCGKDGRNCHRVVRRFECLKSLTAETVWKHWDAP